MIKICKPTTMYGQVLFAMFVGIIIVHCIMLFVALSLGVEYFQKSFLSDRARYIISNYVLLDTVNKDSRLNMANILNNKGLEIEFFEEQPPIKTGVNINSFNMIERLYDLSLDSENPFVKENLLADVSEIESLSLFSLLTKPNPSPTTGMYHAQIGIPFKDGSWVVFKDKGFRAPMPKPYSFTLTIITILSVAFFAFIIVYRILQPLKLFARATEKFGLNVVDAEPLEIKGPLEVRETIIAFNKMQERIVQFVEERSRLLAAISHDLRTPLTRMNLRIEQLQEPLKTAFSKDIKQLQQLMDTSIDLARATANTEKPALVDIPALLESIVDDLRCQGALIEYDSELLEEKIPPIVVRPLCIKRAFVNVLENAVRYASSVKISLENSSSSLSIYITDDGPGIPENMLEKVFEPFFRLEPSRNRGTGGTGLGLAITRTMIQLCGGNISLSNMPEKGLKVSIVLLRR